jgi:predicted Zn-dependent protease
MRRVFLFLMLTLGLYAAGESQDKPKIGSDPVVIADMNRANDAYMAGRLEKSIPLYRSVFDREKTHRTLTPLFWRVLVDNLGMAYGITGNLDSAEAIFRYGISSDSTYPLFYYNLACTYAEREDMEHAIEELTRAYAFKGNMMAGEQFPDPATDDSFKRFLGNKQFKEFLEKMQED